MTGIPQFPKFEVHSDEQSAGVRWNKYVAKLENLFVGMNIDKNKRKKALLLHYSGDEVFDIYETLDLSNTDDNYDDTKQALKNYFMPRKNKEFERFEFRNLKQLKGETIDQYVTKLRQKAELCEFSHKDGEIKSQIIQGCISKKLRLKCLEEDKELKDILLLARSIEIAEKQSAAMDRHDTFSDPVNKIKINHPVHRQKQGNSVNQRPNQKCRNCGGNYPHARECPAVGVQCNYCHKLNHFISVCRKRLGNDRQSKQLHEIAQQKNSCTPDDENSCESDEESLSFGIKQSFNVNKISNSKVPTMLLKINDISTKVLIDTGSSINVLNENVLKKMKPIPHLQQSKTKAYAFGQSQPLNIKGKCVCLVESKEKMMTADFQIISGTSETIISYETAVDLGIVPVIKSLSENSYEIVCDKYKDVFTGLGKLRDRQVKFHIDESVVPTTQPARRIPFHVRDKVEKELEKLEKLDVIEKAAGPTPWVSNLVVAPNPKSPNEIRICVDMRKANLALKRERHVVPTIDDIIMELNGSTVFSKVDLYKGFHQLELSEESRNMTVFATHAGLWRYKRLNFGVSVAPEIFQNEIRQVLNGLHGVMNISDDIIIHGKTQTEHDANLELLLQRLQDSNLTLHKAKCEFGKSKIKFYGYVFSEAGISPDPEKITAIKNVDRPKNQGDVRSFLGMTNYVSRFIENYSAVSEPLRRLTQKNQPFEWTTHQDNSFNQLKNALISDKVMAYFDPSKQTELWCDGSPVGVSAILVQDNRIVSYGSRSLTPVEQRYSQTEREALACVFGCQHFFLYLFGKEFTLITDHRALESIFNNTKHIQSARLERWRLKLTTYNFKVKYRAGNQMISDYCSRHPVNEQSPESFAEDYVRFIAHMSVPSSLTISDIARATQKDCVIKCVMDALANNTWSKQLCYQDDSFRCYQNMCEELTVASLEEGNVLLRGTRLCIPDSLQQHVIKLAHEGHQGRVRSKAFLRETCWFPYMDLRVDEMCKTCIPCMSASPTTIQEPIKPSPLPKQPWDEVSVDFCGPFPTGEYFMVTICDYSRYPVVEKLHSLSAQAVIPQLERIFSLFSVPSVVKTDNGSPFNSQDFSDFTDRLGFKHRKITPLHPMANGTAEAFMKPLVKTMKTTTASGKNFKSELSSFLMSYRGTPHPSTGLSPYELMFNRKMKTKLPQFSVPRKDSYVRETDTKSKLKNKRYADIRRKSKHSTLKPGNKVLVKQQMKNKLDTPFSSSFGKVLSRKGSMVTVQYNDRSITRDASHFKHVPTFNGNVLRRQHHNMSADADGPSLRRSGRKRRPPRKFIDEQ